MGEDKQKKIDGHQLRELTSHVGVVPFGHQSLEESALDVREALVSSVLQLELAGANGERERIHRAGTKMKTVGNERQR